MSLELVPLEKSWYGCALRAFIRIIETLFFPLSVRHGMCQQNRLTSQSAVLLQVLLHHKMASRRNPLQGPYRRHLASRRRESLMRSR